MDTKTAITTLVQSEKIKAGIIWAAQALNQMAGMSEAEKMGAAATIRTVVGMIGQEVHLLRKPTGDAIWVNAEKNIDMALVMIDSGVAHEAAYHLTRALRQVTSKAQRSMAVLIEKGLL